MAYRIILYGDRHQRLVSALTQWDARQSKRDKHHNSHFLGLALQALAEAEEDEPTWNDERIARLAFSGPCLTFILKAIADNPGLIVKA